MAEVIDDKDSKLMQVLADLATVQGNELDERQLARECTAFVSKKDGQWEPEITQNMVGRPRYTFDRTSPIIDLIVGELEQNEFAARTLPTGGLATKDVASTYDGIIRAIQNSSDASSIWKKIGRKLVENGFDAVRIKTKYRDEDSFNQDLCIEYISNSIDRVWFDPNSEKQDRSDAMWVIVLQAITPEAYAEKWPDADPQSISTGNDDYNYDYKRAVVVVGEYYYKKEVTRKLVQMENGQVFDEKKDADQIAVLVENGVGIAKKRDRKQFEVYVRKFDAGQWLDEEQITPFTLLPIVPFYHGFQIVEDKIIWRRIVEKLMDPQRVYNYAASRQIEEGALAPRAKTWMTSEQAKGHQRQLEKMNTSADPIQLYTHVKDHPLPFPTPAPQGNQSLALIAQAASNDIEAISGMYGANMAKNPELQSGKALIAQQDKGDTGNVSFFSDMAVGITAVCRVLVNAIPITYDTTQDFTLIREDGQREVTKINEITAQGEKRNQLKDGRYEVVCEMGTMFKNRLQQGNDAILKVAAVMPEIMATGADIFLQNINAPNMPALAERMRAQLIQQGVIPLSQMTEEEISKLQQEMEAQAQQGQQPDVGTQLIQMQQQIDAMKAMTDGKKADANLIKAQTDAAKNMASIPLTEAQIEKTMVETAKTRAEVIGEHLNNMEKIGQTFPANVGVIQVEQL